MFYPDWILKLKDGTIGIFDTKSGATAINPEGRAKGLADKLKVLNNSNKNKFIGGLVVKENEQWYFYEDEEYQSLEGDNLEYGYSYVPGKLCDNWKPLIEIF